jgi:hypothetical protein
MGEIVSIARLREMQKQDARMHSRARVTNPLPTPGYLDPCVRKEGTVEHIQQVHEGAHAGEWVYLLKVMTLRGHIFHSYLERELTFLIG